MILLCSFISSHTVFLALGTERMGWSADICSRKAVTNKFAVCKCTPYLGVFWFEKTGCFTGDYIISGWWWSHDWNLSSENPWPAVIKGWDIGCWAANGQLRSPKWRVKSGNETLLGSWAESLYNLVVWSQQSWRSKKSTWCCLKPETKAFILYELSFQMDHRKKKKKNKFQHVRTVRLLSKY